MSQLPTKVFDTLASEHFPLLIEGSSAHKYFEKHPEAKKVLRYEQLSSCNETVEPTAKVYLDGSVELSVWTSGRSSFIEHCGTAYRETVPALVGEKELQILLSNHLTQLAVEAWKQEQDAARLEAISQKRKELFGF